MGTFKPQTSSEYFKVLCHMQSWIHSSSQKILCVYFKLRGLKLKIIGFKTSVINNVQYASIPTTKHTRDCQGVSLSNKTQPQENQRGDFILKRLWLWKIPAWFGELERLTLNLAELWKALLQRVRTVSNKRGSVWRGRMITVTNKGADSLWIRPHGPHWLWTYMQFYLSYIGCPHLGALFKQSWVLDCIGTVGVDPWRHGSWQNLCRICGPSWQHRCGKYVLALTVWVVSITFKLTSLPIANCLDTADIEEIKRTTGSKMKEVVIFAVLHHPVLYNSTLANGKQCQQSFPLHIHCATNRTNHQR